MVDRTLLAGRDQWVLALQGIVHLGAAKPVRIAIFFHDSVTQGPRLASLHKRARVLVWFPHAGLVVGAGYLERRDDVPEALEHPGLGITQAKLISFAGDALDVQLHPVFTDGQLAVAQIGLNALIPARNRRLDAVAEVSVVDAGLVFLAVEMDPRFGSQLGGVSAEAPLGQMTGSEMLEGSPTLRFAVPLCAVLLESADRKVFVTRVHATTAGRVAAELPERDVVGTGEPEDDPPIRMKVDIDRMTSFSNPELSMAGRN